MPSRLSVMPAMAITDPRLTDGDIRVLAAICTFTDQQGKCWPSVQAVARMANRSARSVQRSFANLDKCGYLQRVSRWGRSSVSVVKLDTPDGSVTPDASDTLGTTPASPPPDASVTQNVIKERPSRTPQEIGESVELARKIAATANQALRNNPLCHTGDLQVRPLLASSAQQMASDWTTAGIPEAVVLSAIEKVCAAFRPTKENPRIGSFRYFDSSVRKAFKESQEPSEAELKAKARQGMREALG